MPNGELGEFNFLDTPYTIYKNCFNMEYDEGDVVASTCYTSGVQLRIKVIDPVDENDPD